MRWGLEDGHRGQSHAVTKLDTGTRLYDHPEARPLQTDGRADFPICDGAIGA
jgi:hypothetical protein